MSRIAMFRNSDTEKFKMQKIKSEFFYFIYLFILIPDRPEPVPKVTQETPPIANFSLPYLGYLSCISVAMNISWTKKFRFLSKISMFEQNFDFWEKFRFLTKISSFEQNFDFCAKFRFLGKLSGSAQNFQKKIAQKSTSSKKLIFWENFSQLI